MYGFRDRIRSETDIEAIRDWLRTLGKKDLEYYSQHSHYDELPESIKAIGTHSVNFTTDKNGKPMVFFAFGGGLDHWGVEIGMEDIAISQSDYISNTGYRMFVEPGFNIVGW